MFLMKSGLFKITFIVIVVTLFLYGCGGGKITPPPALLVPLCGNGILENGEECDDGNTIDGDGCSSICEEEYLLNKWIAIPEQTSHITIKFEGTPRMGLSRILID